MNSTLYEPSEQQPNRTACAQALRSLKLNIWLAVAVATYVGMLFLDRHHPDWSPGLKSILALAPILPGLLYLWKGLQLLRGLDELQRQIQLTGLLFAAFGTVIVTTVINVSNAHGLVANWAPHGLEVGGAYLTMFILWSIGVTIANLRYR